MKEQRESIAEINRLNKSVDMLKKKNLKVEGHLDKIRLAGENDLMLFHEFVVDSESRIEEFKVFYEKKISWEDFKPLSSEKRFLENLKVNDDSFEEEN